MRVNTPMLRRYVHRVFARRSVEFRGVCSRQWTVCPGEKRKVPPAIHLNGAMDKVQRLCNTRDRDTEMVLLDGGVIEDAPTQAYVVKDVDLVGAFMYSQAAKLQPGFGDEALLLKRYPRKQRMESATLISNNSGSHYFGNFLWDDMPLAILDQDRDRHIAVVKKSYDHEPGYRELLDVPPVPVMQHARIDELTIFSDFAQNASKESRLRTLRARLRKHVTAPQSSGPNIFIRRGQTGERRVMANEDEIERYLASQGFTIIDPTVLSTREIAQRSIEANLVVGVEGSHLAHALYTMADDATFLVLQPPIRFSLVHKEFADRLGMRYSFLVGDPAPEGFSVKLDELRAILDRVL
jgi:Glycosyltransferase 61